MIESLTAADFARCGGRDTTPAMEAEVLVEAAVVDERHEAATILAACISGIHESRRLDARIREIAGKPRHRGQADAIARGKRLSAEALNYGKIAAVVSRARPHLGTGEELRVEIARLIAIV